MICPSCNKSASSLVRSAFSFQGVSRSKNIQGYLKCQQCGTLLRVTGYGTRLWLFYVPAILLLGLFGLSYRYFFALFGNEWGLFLGVLILVTFTSLTINMWKSTRVEKVDADATPTTDSSI